jgi:hypothetical protein
MTVHPERQAAVVLVTDGYPTQCNNAPSAVADAAAAGLADTPSVRTHVIGVGTLALFNLTSFAQAGGTVRAIADDAGLPGSFTAALLGIAESAQPCTYALPPPPSGGWIDYDHVQLVHTPSSTGRTEEVPRLASPSLCGSSPNGGWYYDIDPTVSDPQAIRVCPCTCARLGAGRVEVRIGCSPVTWPG